MVLPLVSLLEGSMVQYNIMPSFAVGQYSAVAVDKERVYTYIHT